MEHLKDQINVVRSEILRRVKQDQLVSLELVESTIDVLNNALAWNLTEDEIAHIAFQIESTMNIGIDNRAIILGNSKNDVKRWFDGSKTEFNWIYWKAYERLLQESGRSIEVLNENEKIIDSILDLSGDPRISEPWKRAGLVMGNVQSGKTQNYLGLINKAMDCGYKIIILLGGHQNELRKQTQLRVDEGVIGAESSHLVQGYQHIPIGVGEWRPERVSTMTTTESDFNRTTANNLRINLHDLNVPIVFTIKKLTPIMKNLFEWIEDFHSLDAENGKKLDLPMLLIDDEADYASINTKAHRDEITATNKYIRKLRGLFNRSTYVAYTATPFANIFIDPESSDEMVNDENLFPKDFMIKIPVPDNYLGQNFYFENNDEGGVREPIVLINDHEEMLPLRHNTKSVVGPLSESLKDAIRAFVISSAIRNIRGDENKHKTMIVNITHLNVHQKELTFMIENYLRELTNLISSNTAFSIEKALNNSAISQIKNTFEMKFNVPETFEEVYKQLYAASAKVKVFGINNSSAQVLDYSLYDLGLSAIVIGGHKLSRGLTLEGLNISYFSRNSKAYDTLMQMCRWFGYRPNYGDLCKVYLPVESNEWYSFISEAINDLYKQLERMSLQGRTPSDFGLKVRAHPGALQVTANHKKETAEAAVLKIDLWGQRQRRFRFFNDDKVNTENFYTAESFVKQLQEMNSNNVSMDENSPSIVIKDVPHKVIIKFLEKMQLQEDDLGDVPLLNHISFMEENELPNFKVIVFNQSSGRAFLWSKHKKFNGIAKNRTSEFAGHSINLANRTVKSDGKLFYPPRAELGSSGDESLGLSNEVVKKMKAETSRSLGHFDYIRSKSRDYPLLIIYLFNLAAAEPYEKFTSKDYESIDVSLPFKDPTVGLSISFPILENQKNMNRKDIGIMNRESMQLVETNKVFRQMEMFTTPEDD
jgi:hypothetical protein